MDFGFWHSLFFLGIEQLDDPIGDINGLRGIENNGLILFQDHGISLIGPQLLDSLLEAQGDGSFLLNPFLIKFVLVILPHLWNSRALLWYSFSLAALASVFNMGACFSRVSFIV